MKAAQISEYGDASVIQINEADTPSITQGQVLVEVHAASLNPVDTALRAGYMKEMAPLHLPVTLGGDIAGVVTDVAGDVVGVRAGDKVYGQSLAVMGNSGAFAQFAATAAAQIARAPMNLDFQQAASLPLVGVSALQALNAHINLQKGQKIFIHGGAGGIGSVAVQVAKHIGAYVAATATGDDVDYVTELGADEVIDYKTSDFSEVLSNYDAVFDTVGGDDFNKALGILKTGGVAVSMIARADEAKAGERGVTAITQMTRVTTEGLDELTKLVESGAVKTRVGKVFPLARIREAFEAREAGNIRGKVVIEIP